MLGKSELFCDLISKNVSAEGHTRRDCSVERVNVSMIVSPHVADWGLGGAMKFYSCGADGESCDKTAFRRMFPSPSLPLFTTQPKYLTSNQMFRGYASFLLNLLQHKRAVFWRRVLSQGRGGKTSSVNSLFGMTDMSGGNNLTIKFTITITYKSSPFPSL